MPTEPTLTTPTGAEPAKPATGVAAASATELAPKATLFTTDTAAPLPNAMALSLLTWVLLPMAMAFLTLLATVTLEPNTCALLKPLPKVLSKPPTKLLLPSCKVLLLPITVFWNDLPTALPITLLLIPLTLALVDVSTTLPIPVMLLLAEAFKPLPMPITLEANDALLLFCPPICATAMLLTDPLPEPNNKASEPPVVVLALPKDTEPTLLVITLVLPMAIAFAAPDTVAWWPKAMALVAVISVAAFTPMAMESAPWAPVLS